MVTVPISDGLYRSVSVATLWALLHLDRALAIAQSAQGYPGKRKSVSGEEVAAHLRGDVSLAFAALRGSRALFVAIDIDARFPKLLPDLRRIVVTFGGAQLSAACFITEGSDQERGKLIICFAQPAPARFARRLAQRLRQRVRACEAASSLDTEDVSAFPQDKTGGLVRVLGRNQARNGPVERAFTLDGELSDLAVVSPLPLAALSAIATRLGGEHPPWLERYIQKPWASSDGTHTHYRRMVAIAREAIRQRGMTNGRSLYDKWLQQVKANSPQLATPSLKTSDPRNVLDHGRERAWEYARREPSSWTPLELGPRRYARGVMRVYNALVQHAQSNGLPPSRFALDYERLGAMMGCQKPTAWRRASRAAALGIINIHDRGSPDSPGKKGRCTIFGLVVNKVAGE